jgi:hypothetical protein
MRSKGAVRHIIFVTGRVDGGERDRVQKFTALELHRQCPLVLLVKIILEACWALWRIEN